MQSVCPGISRMTFLSSSPPPPPSHVPRLRPEDRIVVVYEIVLASFARIWIVYSCSVDIANYKQQQTTLSFFLSFLSSRRSRLAWWECGVCVVVPETSWAVWPDFLLRRGVCTYGGTKVWSHCTPFLPSVCYFLLPKTRKEKETTTRKLQIWRR